MDNNNNATDLHVNVTIPGRPDLAFEFRGTQADMWQEISERMATVPAGVFPEFDYLEGEPEPVTEPEQAPAHAEAEPAPRVEVVEPEATPEPVRGVTVDAEGKARSEADEAAALEAGFAPAKPLYATGTMVVDWGVRNADASRKDWEAQPPIQGALHNLADTVRAERRSDRTVNTGSIRMDKQGRIVDPATGERFAVEPEAFGQLCNAVGLPKAGSYLAACDPDLRARNVNQWLSGAQGPWAAKDMVLRTRESEAGRVIFAAVSEKYRTYDTDTIARQLADVMPESGRGDVFYNGSRMQVDATWHSDIKPESYVAGEFFKAGMRVRSSDTGGGSLQGSAMLWRNLCLNLIIVDQSTVGLFRMRHLGRVNMAAKVAQGMRKGQQVIRYFTEKWNAARADDLTEAGRVFNLADTSEPVPTESLTDLMWGAFLAEQRRESIAIKRGEVGDVMAAWQKEPEANRAGFANALTRYAQDVDPFRADDIERSAGRMLASTAPIAWEAPKR